MQAQLEACPWEGVLGPEPKAHWQCHPDSSIQHPANPIGFQCLSFPTHKAPLCVLGVCNEQGTFLDELTRYHKHLWLVLERSQ